MNPNLSSTDAESTHQSPAVFDTEVVIDQQPYSPYYPRSILNICKDDCHHLYTEDSLNSCLASRLLSGI